MRLRSVVGLGAVAAATTALLAAVLPGAAAAAATALAAGRAPAGAPACAWRVEAGVTAVDAALPDSNAVYWITQYTVQPGLRIVLDGTYADARYTSLTTYGSTLAPFTVNGVGSELTDYRIAPNAGSANPWQQNAAPGGRFTVTLAGDAAPGRTNVLPIAPAAARPGATGYLVYRVYLPAGGPPAVPLPAMTWEWDGASTPIPTCPPRAADTGAAALPAVAPPAAAVAPTGTGQFARSSDSSGSLFPNPDNGYLSAAVTPPDGDDVVVVRAKAPTTPGGTHPAPWPSAAQTRYWSLCTYVPVPPLPVVVNPLPGGGSDDGCRADDVTRLDDAGYYTFALGTEAQRAAVEAIPGVTFVPFSAADPTATHSVLLRNLLGTFPQAVQQVPADGDPASAQAVMGPYYPTTAVCALSTLAAGGPTACVPAK